MKNSFLNSTPENTPQSQQPENKDKKKNWFERNAKSIVAGVAMMGSVAATEGVQAQSPHHYNNKPEMEKGMDEKTSWAKEAVENAHKDMSYLKTADDAAEQERLLLQPFIHHIGMMSQGAETQAHYSYEEYQYILKELETLGKTFDSLEQEFSFRRNPFYQDVHDQLTYKTNHYLQQ